MVFFNEFCKIFILRTPFQRTHPDDCVWYLENSTFKLLILNKFVNSINIVDRISISCWHSIYILWLETQILLRHNSLKSDIFFNPTYIPCFPGSVFFRVQGFQGLGPGFRSSLIKLHLTRIQVQIQVYKESNISVYIIIILFIFHLKSFSLWNKMKWILLRQCAHVFHHYCHHCITNISQCNNINRNKKNLNKLHDD